MRHLFLPIGMALAAATLVTAQDKAPEPEKPGEVNVVARTRAQLSSLRAALEEIRGEKLKTEVAVKGVTEESLAPASKADLDKRYDTRSPQIARAYARIGLFPKDYSLRQFLSANASAVLAYYEPSERTMYVVKHEPALEIAPDATAVHELDHALQDQRFDLVGYYHFSNDPDPIAMNDDAQLARRFVVEGEARYVEYLYEARKEKLEAKVDELVERQAALTRPELLKLERKHVDRMGGGKGLMKAVMAEESLPPYLFRTMSDPYLKGPWLIAQVRKQGGWKAVDELFTKAPRSAKEVLHPEKLHVALDPIEIPDLAVAIGSGFKRTFENTLGEIGIACALETKALSKKAPEVAAKIAATWLGDRFQAYENAAHATCAIWVTSWETDAAAKEFEVGAKEIMKSEWSTTADSFVERHGKRILLVLGAPRDRSRQIIEGALGAK